MNDDNTYGDMDGDDVTSPSTTTTTGGGTVTTTSGGAGSGSSEPTSLITCSFNQDGGCLAIGTTTGFSVHNVHPQYSLSVERELRGGIGHVEMLFRCNLMALVGGGPQPHSAPHRVLIWDDHVPKEIGELSFRQPVLQVKLRKDAIAVALRDRVYVYHLADLSLRDKIYTADNPFGLLSLSTQVQKDMVLACPSVTTGHVRVELYGLRKTMLLEAHEGTLRALCLTADGTLLATASNKGTVIRVWNVSTSTCLHEFRRGVERATISCLAFSWDDQWLACTSDKGTTHVFFCNPEDSSSSSSSSKSTSSSLTKRLFSAATSASSSKKKEKKSVCQVRGIPHPLACAFIGDVPNVVAVAGWDADGNGVLLISEFAAHQEPRRIAYHVLVKKASIETEEERRRRRARGWKPSKPDTPNLENDPHFIESLQISEATMNHQLLSHDDDDFCEVIVENTTTTTNNNVTNEEPVIEDPHPDEPAVGEGERTTSTTTTTTTLDSTTVSEKEDSVRTEPLDDDDDPTSALNSGGEATSAGLSEPTTTTTTTSSASTTTQGAVEATQ